MKTQIIKKDIDWVHVKNECRNTVGKHATENVPSDEFKRSMMICEHSPIRCLRVTIHWEDIKSWIATHFARHHIGVEKWISTQRSDRTNVNRDKSPQDTPVMMDMEANAQADINMARVRLCNQAHKETREYEEDKKIVYSLDDDTKEIAWAMVPNCIYRFGCPEFTACGYFNKFISWCSEQGYSLEQLTDIKTRYDLYNKYFDSLHCVNDAK